MREVKRGIDSGSIPMESKSSWLFPEEVIKVELDVIDINSGTGVKPERIFTGKKGRMTFGKNNRNMGSIIIKYKRYIIIDSALFLKMETTIRAKHI